MRIRDGGGGGGRGGGGLGWVRNIFFRKTFPRY